MGIANKIGAVGLGALGAAAWVAESGVRLLVPGLPMSKEHSTHAASKVVKGTAIATALFVGGAVATGGLSLGVAAIGGVTVGMLTGIAGMIIHEKKDDTFYSRGEEGWKEKRQAFFDRKHPIASRLFQAAANIWSHNSEDLSVGNEDAVLTDPPPFPTDPEIEIPRVPRNQVIETGFGPDQQY